MINKLTTALLLSAFVLVACSEDKKAPVVVPTDEAQPEPDCSTPGRRDESGRPIPVC